MARFDSRCGAKVGKIEYSGGGVEGGVMVVVVVEGALCGSSAMVVWRRGK